MKKNRAYFFRMAILKTALTALFYLLVPLFAKWYIPKVGGYWAYSIFSSAICIIINIVLLIQSWILAFDPEARKDYLNEE
jgi:uncharacterized membrane protein